MLKMLLYEGGWVQSCKDKCTKSKNSASSSFVYIIITFVSKLTGTNNIIKVARNVHEGSVFSICVLKEGSIITGGGKDGKLIQFDTSMHPTGYEAQVNYYYY